MAAKISIRLEPVQKNRVVNLRALSKNSQKKIDKKQPRANDYEIEFEPAPDSAFSLNTPLKQTLEKTPSTVGSIKINKTQKNKADISTPKSKRKIDLSIILEEENEINTNPTVLDSLNDKREPLESY